MKSQNAAAHKKTLACCICEAHCSSSRCTVVLCFLGRFLPRLGGAKSSAVFSPGPALGSSVNRQEQSGIFFIYVAEVPTSRFHPPSHRPSPAIPLPLRSWRLG